MKDLVFMRLQFDARWHQKPKSRSCWTEDVERTTPTTNTEASEFIRRNFFELFSKGRLWSNLWMGASFSVLSLWVIKFLVCNEWVDAGDDNWLTNSPACGYGMTQFRQKISSVYYSFKRSLKQLVTKLLVFLNCNGLWILKILALKQTANQKLNVFRAWIGEGECSGALIQRPLLWNFFFVIYGENLWTNFACNHC